MIRLSIFIVTFILSAYARATTWTVMIDPGHGGNDRGAVYAGLKEADLVLSVSQKLRQLFQNDSRFVIEMTRNEDRTLTLQDRIHKAETQKADLIVSIHANAAQDPRARGVEFYVQNPLPTDEESLFLAHQESQIVAASTFREDDSLSKSKDVAAIIEDLQRQNKFFKSLELSELLKKSWQTSRPKSLVSIKQAPFYMISQGRIPSVLIEIGFLSHPQESQLLKDVHYQKEIAEIIHKGILKYLDAESETLSSL